MGKYTPAFLGAMNGALRKELGIPLDREYRAIDFAVNGRWDYSGNVSPTEARTAAMRRNENLRIFFGSGYYDLVTPPGMVRYLADHLNLPGERITIREYESGHMPYLGEESAAQLECDLRKFIRAASEAVQ
jgi:carboxypeptidase C (cathepsin A)